MTDSAPPQAICKDPSIWKELANSSNNQDLARTRELLKCFQVESSRKAAVVQVLNNLPEPLQWQGMQIVNLLLESTNALEFLEMALRQNKKGIARYAYPRLTRAELETLTPEQDSGLFGSRCHEDIPGAVQFLEEQGIRSELAKYTILQACSSTHHPVALGDATDRWLQETATIRPLDKVVRDRFPAPENRHRAATCFALYVLYYLQFNHKSWEPGSKPPDPYSPASCPYTTDAKNFIVTLAETGGCQCFCYTNYVRAMAEEYGYGEVYGCNQIGHVNIMIVDPTSPKEVGVQTTTWNYPGLAMDPAVVTTPAIYTVLDAGFRDNYFMEITTTEADQKFVELYNLRYLTKLKVNTVTEITCRRGEWGNSTATRWNVITSVLNHIQTRADRSRYEFDIGIVEQVWGLDLGVLKEIYRLLKQPNGSGKPQLSIIKDLIQPFKQSLQVIADRWVEYPAPEQVSAILHSAFSDQITLPKFFQSEATPSCNVVTDPPLQALLLGFFEQFEGEPQFEPAPVLDFLHWVFGSQEEEVGIKFNSQYRVLRDLYLVLENTTQPSELVYPAAQKLAHKLGRAIPEGQSGS